MKKIFLPLLSLALCVGVLGKWTNGFEAFTVFSHTLEEAGGESGQIFPDIRLINQDSVVYQLEAHSNYKLINFVYLDCPDVCHKVNNRLEDIYQMIPQDEFKKDLGFYTISFDVHHDNVQKIRKYREWFGDHINGWDFAVPYRMEPAAFSNFLRKAGIWAEKVPGTALINHSVYIFLVSPDNQVKEVFDPARQSNQDIVKKIQSWIPQNYASSL